jgi:hypothetical protein
MLWTSAQTLLDCATSFLTVAKASQPPMDVSAKGGELLQILRLDGPVTASEALLLTFCKSSYLLLPRPPSRN